MRRDVPVTLLYHFFHPDGVVSARLFSDLAADLARRGWPVEAWTSNRTIADRARTVEPADERWRGVRIRRFPRPSRP